MVTSTINYDDGSGEGLSGMQGGFLQLLGPDGTSGAGRAVTI